MTQPVATAAPPRPASTPRVWLVTGYRAGERGQIVALAEALGWSYELKQFRYRQYGVLSSLLRGRDLRGVHVAESSPLVPPWPDLVISAGMRNEPVARWIQRQAGGKTRLVHIGRPWSQPEKFDLLVTTPQYRLPAGATILQNHLTLHAVTPAVLAASAARVQARYAHLPAPYIGVILGGDSGPYTLGKRSAARIAQRACDLARAQGGSLLITSSARTPARALAAFEQHLSVPYDLYRWQPHDAQNPYSGILGLSTSLVVTADSVSMLSEACATGKPVYMAELSGYGWPMRVAGDAPFDFKLSALLYGAVMRFGHRRLSRDLRLVHQALLEDGRAVWLGERFKQPPPATPPADMARAVQRVRTLFD